MDSGEREGLGTALDVTTCKLSKTHCDGVGGDLRSVLLAVSPLSAAMGA